MFISYIKFIQTHSVIRQLAERTPLFAKRGAGGELALTSHFMLVKKL
jgi:hypothetical protein